jgi:hypothetical protein
MLTYFVATQSPVHVLPHLPDWYPSYAAQGSAVALVGILRLLPSVCIHLARSLQTDVVLGFLVLCATAA